LQNNIKGNNISDMNEKIKIKPVNDVGVKRFLNQDNAILFSYLFGGFAVTPAVLYGLTLIIDNEVAFRNSIIAGLALIGLFLGVLFSKDKQVNKQAPSWLDSVERQYKDEKNDNSLLPPTGSNE
jgi:hypothetical protein